MKKILFTLIIISISLLLKSCGAYNFTGTGDLNAKTFQVNFFQNYSKQIIEPGLDRDYTNALQDLILNQTNLDLVKNNGDLLYEGEIVEHRISPMSATSSNTAAQNRMTISINVRFSHRNKPQDDFEKRFSFFYDYSADELPSAINATAFEIIFDRINQDVFNASLAKW